MQNQARSTKRNSAIDQLATPGLFQCLSYISFGYNFEHSS